MCKRLSPPCLRRAQSALLLFRGRRWDGTGEDSLDRFAPLLFVNRVGQRLTRNHLVALGGVINDDRFDRGDLLQVGWLQSLDDILVGMVGAAFVIEIILNE